MKLEGLIVPLITPLNPDETLDVEHLAKLIEYVLAGGVDAVFLLGSTGEFPNLSMATKESLLRAATEIINGRVPILVGVARAGTRTTIEEGQHLAQFGADAFVALPPYYFGHSQAELVTHFRTIARELQTPLVMYNIPRLVKHTLQAETVAQLACEPMIIGIKNTDMDLDAFDRLLEIRDQYPDVFGVSQGDLPIAAECVLRGANGMTLGVANIAPALCKKMFEAAKAGDRVRAEELNHQLHQMDPTGITKSWSAGIKMQASLLGLCQPTIAKPFDPIDGEDLELLRNKLAGVNLL